MSQVIGGRAYHDIAIKSQQVKCFECVFAYLNDAPYQRKIYPMKCGLMERPIRDPQRESCKKGKVPL